MALRVRSISPDGRRILSGSGRYEMKDGRPLLQDGKRVIRKKISKQDMARMIGASREMVSKVMRDLEVGGYIDVRDDMIVITGA